MKCMFASNTVKHIIHEHIQLYTQYLINKSTCIRENVCIKIPTTPQQKKNKLLTTIFFKLCLSSQQLTYYIYYSSISD